MATFEAAHYTSATRLSKNLYDICNGVTPTNHNGIDDTHLNVSSGSALASPYNAAFFGPWQVSDGDNIQEDTSANQSFSDFMRAVYAPGTVLSGVKRYMQGRCKDMLAGDLGRHDVITTIAGVGPVGAYPKGWQTPALRGTYYRFTSGRSGDDHFIETKTGGFRDSLTVRAPQRAAVLAIAALIDPTYVIPVELSGGSSVVRQVLITTALDDSVRTLANYQIEPTTQANRYGVPGWNGVSTNVDSQRVDAPATGYWMYLIELWHLVHAGASYASYYSPLGTW